MLGQSFRTLEEFYWEIFGGQQVLELWAGRHRSSAVLMRNFAFLGVFFDVCLILWSSPGLMASLSLFVALYVCPPELSKGLGSAWIMARGKGLVFRASNFRETWVVLVTPSSDIAGVFTARSACHVPSPNLPYAFIAASRLPGPADATRRVAYSALS